jgi:hypothetical protein
MVTHRIDVEVVTCDWCSATADLEAVNEDWQRSDLNGWMIVTPARPFVRGGAVPDMKHMCAKCSVQALKKDK